MDHFAGLDVSVNETSVCIVDDTGRIVREVRVASEPDALLPVLTNPAYHFRRIGLEAGPLSQWLFSALAEAELPVVCVETRHMQAVPPEGDTNWRAVPASRDGRGARRPRRMAGVVIRRQTPPNSYRQSRRQPGTNSSTDRSHHRNTTRNNSPLVAQTGYPGRSLRREYGLVPSQRVSDGTSPSGRAGCLSVDELPPSR